MVGSSGASFSPLTPLIYALEIPHQQIHIVWELLFFIEQELSAAHGISPQEMHRLVRSLHGRVGKHETEPGQKNQHSGFQSQVLFEEMRGQKQPEDTRRKSRRR